MLLSVENRKIYNDYYINKYIVVASVSGIMGTILSNFKVLAFLFVILEIALLIFLLIKKNYATYVCYFLIFTSMSIEYDYYLGGGHNYGFKYFEILGVNLPVFFLIPLALLAIINYKSTIANLKKFRFLYIFVCAQVMLSILSILIGFFSLLFNVNGIQEMPGAIYTFITITYQTIGLTTLPIIAFIFILRFQNIQEIYSCIISILLALTINMIFSFLTGFLGSYGGGATLYVSIASFYVPFIILFATKKEIDNKFSYFVLGFCAIIFSLLYTTMGKQIILVLVIPFLAVIYLLRRKTPLNLMMISVMTVITISVLMIAVNSAEYGGLFQWKIEQVRELMFFWKKSWIENMSISPRTRVEEFLNISLNYAEKPFSLIFGRGIMGTYFDYRTFLSSIDKNIVLSSSTLWEWQNGLYFTTHETLNKLYLSNGLTGIAFILAVLYLFLRYLRKSIFLIIGVVWFMLFYGWSVTISILGIICLLLGLIEIDWENKNF